jgi:hypothetical protein
MRRFWEIFNGEVGGVVFWPVMVLVIGILTAVVFSLHA